LLIGVAARPAADGAFTHSSVFCLPHRSLPISLTPNPRYGCGRPGPPLPAACPFIGVKKARQEERPMKLRALALGAVLLAAAIPALSSPASATWRGHGWRWSALAYYYPPDAYYYPPPYDGFGPVGPFVGHQPNDGIWHPGYWRLGHRGHRYAGYWW
jgi:hypothetical protein